MNILPIPFWLKPIDSIFGSSWYYGKFEADILMENPKQLSLEEFKKLLVNLIGHEKESYEGRAYGSRKFQQLVQAADCYKDAIYALWGDFAFEKSEHPWKPPAVKSKPTVKKRRPKA